MFRILGAFKSVEEIQKKFEGNKGPHVYAVPAWEWFPITKAPTKPEDVEKVQKATIERVKTYIESKKDDAETVLNETADDMAEIRYNKSFELNKKVENLTKFLTDDDGAGAVDTTGLIQRDEEVRNQRYAVVSILCDPDPDDEPLICFTRFFDLKDEAIDYNRNTLHEHGIDTDCFVVDMYEWISPLLVKTSTFADVVPSSYTHTQLEDLHNGRRWEQSMCDRLIADHKKQQSEKVTNEKITEEA